MTSTNAAFSLHSVPSIPVAELSTASLTTDRFVSEFRTRGTPVVIRQLMSEPEWTLSFLCEQLGDREFPVRYYGQERYQQAKQQWTSMGSGVETRSMPFSTYAQLLENGEARQQDLYLGKCSLKSTPLAESAGLQQVEAQLGLRQPVSAANLWVGMGSHVTCLHCDPFDGILMQMGGAKRLVLFPPSQLPNLYPFPVFAHLRHGLKRRASYSQVYPDRPDFTAFPKFAAALQQRHEVILEPGDVLFIPVGWWHEVTALGDGVVCSVNRFWSVFPRQRVWRSWNKWRIHLGSVLAAPHIAWGLLSSLGNPQQYRSFVQRL
jgi:lysine-specific demethylase 8/hypoxia-inducible factor 1-alpha inhibitor (HIF hydroxylase)